MTNGLNNRGKCPGRPQRENPVHDGIQKKPQKKSSAMMEQFGSDLRCLHGPTSPPAHWCFCFPSGPTGRVSMTGHNPIHPGVFQSYCLPLSPAKKKFTFLDGLQCRGGQGRRQGRAALSPVGGQPLTPSIGTTHPQDNLGNQDKLFVATSFSLKKGVSCVLFCLFNLRDEKRFPTYPLLNSKGRIIPEV